MNPGATRRTLLWALLFVALGGFLLHYRIHPFLVPDREHPGRLLFHGSFLAASLLPLLDVVVVTALFSARRTAVWGYLLNGLIVIYGTVLMAHFSIAMLGPKGPAAVDWLLKSTFPDILVAWGDFMIGKALYNSWMQEA